MLNQNNDDQQAIQQTFLKSKDSLIEKEIYSEGEVIYGFYMASLGQLVRKVKISEKVIEIKRIFWLLKVCLINEYGHSEKFVDKVSNRTVLIMYLDFFESPETKRLTLETRDIVDQLRQIDFQRHAVN